MESVIVTIYRKRVTGGNQTLVERKLFPVGCLPHTGEWMFLQYSRSEETHSQVLKFTPHIRMDSWGNMVVDHIEIEIA